MRTETVYLCERSDRTLKKRDLYGSDIAAIIVCIVIILAVAGFFGYKLYEKHHTQEMFADMADGKLTRLLSRQSELQSRINDINSRMICSGEGPLVILFAEPAEKLEGEVIPAMEQQKYPGIIAVSDKYFPGYDNCLSVRKTKKLLDEGWELAITCTDSTDIKALLDEVRDAGLSKPAAAYYPTGMTTPDEEELQELGIDVIIRYNVSPDSRTYESSSEVTGIMAYGCSDEKHESRFQNAVSRGEAFAYEVGFLSSRSQCGDMEEWLEDIQTSADDNGCEITNITDAVSIVKSNMKKMKEDNEELYNERSLLIRKLEKVNQDIESIN